MKCLYPQEVYNGYTSPPARVVWIEIGSQQAEGQGSRVATREGGVD